MAFYFDDIAYATDHPHSTFDLHRFMDRLEGPAFRINDRTDYQQLKALVGLLDIAVDDGRCVYLDLANRAAADRFDEDVDNLVLTIKDVFRSIGTPGAAFISRIEAKETLELVSQRIADTLRSRPKAKKTVFDAPMLKQEDYRGEKAAMKNFVKWKQPKDNAHATAR